VPAQGRATEVARGGRGRTTHPRGPPAPGRLVPACQPVVRVYP